MSDYRVVYHGRLVPGFARDEVIANLTTLFELSESSADSLLANPPQILCAELSVEQANELLEQLAYAGLMTRLERPGVLPVERRQHRRRYLLDRRKRTRGGILPERRSGRERRQGRRIT